METIKLVTKACPDCKTEFDSNIFYWQHTCGQDVFLDRNACVHCYKCGLMWELSELDFKCKERCVSRSNVRRIRPGLYRSLAGILLIKEHSPVDGFLDDVLKNLRLQCINYKD